MIRNPHDIPWEVAGSLAGAGGTAYAVLKQLRLKAGETLLIHAAAGGVGTFAVQLAVARGVKVIGTASERNHDYLRSIGATPVTSGDGLLERVRSVAPQGVDAVLDASGRRQSGRRHPRRSLLRQSPTLRRGGPLTAGLLRSRDMTEIGRAS